MICKAAADIGGHKIGSACPLEYGSTVKDHLFIPNRDRVVRIRQSKKKDIMFVFITDSNHNYVLLRNEFKGLNFVIIPSDHELVADRIRNVFGDGVKFDELDSLHPAGGTTDVFVRVVIKTFIPENLKPTHEWVSLDQIKRYRKINTKVQRYINQLQLPSMCHSAGIIVTDLDQDSDRMLLVKGRSSKLFGVPKGHLLPCEDPQDAAVREMLEETGIKVERLSARTLDLKRTRLYFTSISQLENNESEPIDKEEVDEAKWLTRQEIGHSPITNLTRQILRQITK